MNILGQNIIGIWTFGGGRSAWRYKESWARALTISSDAL